MQVIKEATQALPGTQATQFGDKVWDDGKHPNVVKITATVKKDKLTSIQFEYLGSKGSTHGKPDGDIKEFSLNPVHEYLVFTKMGEASDSHGRIIFLTFETNTGRKFTPVGKDPLTTPAGEGKIIGLGKIIGFFGIEDKTYVYAPIGAHKK